MYWWIGLATMTTYTQKITFGDPGYMVPSLTRCERRRRIR
jgi:hypothetical protein